MPFTPVTLHAQRSRVLLQSHTPRHRVSRQPVTSEVVRHGSF